MKHHAGLDVSVKETSDCILDAGGTICREKRQWLTRKIWSPSEVIPQWP